MRSRCRRRSSSPASPRRRGRIARRARRIWRRQNLITGATSYRWLILSRNNSKQLNIAFNNDNVGLNFPDVDLRELPPDFSLNVIGSKGDATDRLFTFTNYSSGQTFGGEIDDLIVCPRAMTEDQLSRLAR